MDTTRYIHTETYLPIRSLYSVGTPSVCTLFFTCIVQQHSTYHSKSFITSYNCWHHKRYFNELLSHAYSCILVCIHCSKLRSGRSGRKAVSEGDVLPSFECATVVQANNTRLSAPQRPWSATCHALGRSQYLRVLKQCWQTKQCLRIRMSHFSYGLYFQPWACIFCSNEMNNATYLLFRFAGRLQDLVGTVSSSLFAIS